MAEAPHWGDLYWYDFPEPQGRRPVLVVSNDRRNRLLREVLVVPLTTTDKSKVPTSVELAPEDPAKGWIVCDSIQLVAKANLDRRIGSLTCATMLQVQSALMDTLGIRL